MASPPSKGRIQQRLKQQAERQFKKMQGRNPAGHIWLARHFERQNGRCAYCGIPMLLPSLRGKKKPANRRATLDHVVPLVRGGADSEANTVAACVACNTAKADISAQIYRFSAFCIARKAYAATIPERKAAPIIVTVRKPSRR